MWNRTSAWFRVVEPRASHVQAAGPARCR